jgi:hypothetical protein
MIIGFNLNKSFNYYSDSLKRNKINIKTKSKNKLNNNSNSFASLTSKNSMIKLNNKIDNIEPVETVKPIEPVEPNNRNDNKITKRQYIDSHSVYNFKYEPIYNYDSFTIKNLKIDELIAQLEKMKKKTIIHIIKKIFH